MKKISIILSLLCITGSLPAQWTATGPEGGQVRSGLTLGTDLLAGTNSGIYRSSDGGLTFSPHSVGIPSGNILDLFQDGSFLFACIEEKGIYRSADGGVSWELKLPGRYLLQNTVSRIRMQKADGHLMVRNNNDLKDTLYFSADFGDTWVRQPISPFSLLSNQVFGFGDAFFTNSLAGVLGPVQGLYRTEDLGQSWVYSGNGMPSGQNVNNMVSINDTLYVLQKHIYRSTDNGFNWTQVTTDTLKNPSANFAFVPGYYTVVGRTVYARNGGNASIVCTSWTPGQSRWQPPVAGSPTTGAALAMFSHAGKAFQSGFNGELYTVSSQLQAWTLSAPSGLLSLPVNDLFASGSLALATVATRFLAGGDGSTGWAAVNPQNISDNVPLRAVAQLGATYLMGVTAGNNTLTIYRSQDQGLTWQSAGATDLLPEARFRVIGDSLAVFGTDGGPIPVAYIVNSQGQITASLTGASGFNGITEWLALTPHKGELFGLATRRGNLTSRIFRRGPSAGNWITVNSFPEGAYALESWQNQLFIGLATGGVKVSADNGATWTDLSTGLDGAIVNHLHAFGDFLAAATNRGVFLFQAGDSDWTSLGFNLPVSDIRKVQASGQYLWAQVDGGSVWRLLREGNVYAQPLANAPVFTLSPNPADEVIRVEVAGVSSFQWEIMDSQGKKIHSGQVTGPSDALLSLEALPAGLYLCRIRSAQGLAVQRFVRR